MKFIFTCGGTAGHINPALAIAGRLRELMPDCEVLFIGAEGKMEMELVPREGYEIKPLKITNISRGHSLSAMVHNLETLKNVAVSTHEAKKIIRNFKPDAVIGTGGYVCYVQSDHTVPALPQDPVPQPAHPAISAFWSRT